MRMYNYGYCRKSHLDGTVIPALRCRLDGTVASAFVYTLLFYVQDGHIYVT